MTELLELAVVNIFYFFVSKVAQKNITFYLAAAR